MVLGSPPSPSSGADGSPRRKVHRVAMLAAVLGLVACNPVETWRDWSGASKNDPDPETARNTQNLAAGEAADYPNLASVPPPPNRALTAAEREKLTQSLIADRTNAKYSDERLRAGFPAVSAPAPPPPPPPVPEAVNPAPAKPGESVAAPSAPAPAPAAASGEAPAAPAPPGEQGLRKSGDRWSRASKCRRCARHPTPSKFKQHPRRHIRYRRPPRQMPRLPHRVSNHLLPPLRCRPRSIRRPTSRLRRLRYWRLSPAPAGASRNHPLQPPAPRSPRSGSPPTRQT